MSTTEVPNPEERFKVYRLCDCERCDAAGKITTPEGRIRCPDCRGEGKQRETVALCSEENLGSTIIELGKKGTWADCPFGLLDTMGKVNEKWLVRPWLPSARNISDAGRTLAVARHTGKEL